MVFMKKANKGGKPNQKTQGKKPFQKVEDIEDSDDAVVSKTPKGRQSMNEKRVSFQVAGKNTPAKTPVGKKQATPGKDSAKKQATPGKGGLQKFQGMEQKKKGSQPEEDDDEDDEDDDDEEDDSDFDGDLDLAVGSEEDDEDDDDDDDDDDEDDDEDDEDEEESNQKNVIMKGQKQTPSKGALQSPKIAKQTPSKGNEKQSAQTPVKSPKKGNVAASPKANVVASLEEERRSQRDATQLFLGNLPKETTVPELQELSTDIVSVVIPKREKATRAFAFLKFASEEKAEENFKKLKNKTFKGASLTIDYVGSKSTKQQQNNADFNPKKLFVSGLPIDVTVAQVAKFFPKCHTVSLNQSESYRAATVSFWSEEDGNAAFQEVKELEIKGVKASVLHSKGSKLLNNKRKRMTRKNRPKKEGNGLMKKDGGHVAKRMKFMKKAGSDDE